MRLFLLFFVLGFAMGHTKAVVAADSSASLRAREKVAKKACVTGDYLKGIDILADLYIETNDPTILYNQGRCYEQNSQFEKAIDLFREYLRKMPDLNATEKTGVENHITECENLLHKTAPALQTSPRESSPPREAPTQANSKSEPLLAETITLPTSATSSAGTHLRIAGFVSTGIGVAAIATGVVCALKTQSLTKDIYDPGINSKTYSSKESSRSTYAKWSLVGYVVGSAAVVSGVILYLMGRDNVEDHTKGTELTFLPTLAPGEAGFLLNGRF